MKNGKIGFPYDLQYVHAAARFSATYVIHLHDRRTIPVKFWKSYSSIFGLDKLMLNNRDSLVFLFVSCQLKLNS